MLNIVKQRKYLLYKKIYLCLFVFATLFMAIGYASINSIILDLEGRLNVNLPTGVYISEVNYKDGNYVNVSDMKINSSASTMLNSRVVLSPTEKTSSVTYSVTIYNNTSSNYYYKESTYDNGGLFYDNLNIIYTISGLQLGDELKSKSQITFDITFSYKDSTLSENNILNSYIKFNFLSKEESNKVTFVYNNQIYSQVLKKDTTSYTYDGINIASGAVARCDNASVPAVQNNILTVNNIINDTECYIFDSLHESVSTANNTENNMLMINNEIATGINSTMVIGSNQTINIDLNGKNINATTSNALIPYISNYGHLVFKDSQNSGTVTVNYRFINNEAGTLTVDSGNYKRYNSESNDGGIVIVVSGIANIKNCNMTTDKVYAIFNWGSEESYTYIDNCYIDTNSSPAIANASNDELISVTNSTIISDTAAFLGRRSFNANETNHSGPIYLCNTNISGSSDFASTASSRLYYSANVSFSNGTNTSSSNNTIKNYNTNCNKDWFFVKHKTNNDNYDYATYTSGKKIRIGDVIQIKTSIDENYVIDIANADFADQANIQMHSQTGNIAQKFTFLTSAQENYYNIVETNYHNYAITIKSPQTNESNIVLYQFADYYHQKYFLSNYDSQTNSYNINTDFGVLVTIDNTQKNVWDGNNVWAYEPLGINTQMWKFTRY